MVVVCCVVCCGCDKPVLATLLVEQVEIRLAKMSAFITKNASLDAPNVRGCQKSSLSLDFGHVLTFGLKRDIGAL